MSDEGNRDSGEFERSVDDAKASSAADDWIRQIDERTRRFDLMLGEFWNGTTPWHKKVDERFDALNVRTKLISNQVLALSATRIVWPAVSVLVALFFGAMAGQLIVTLIQMLK